MNTARTIAARTLAWVASLAAFTILWAAAFTVCVLLPVYLLTR